MGRARGGEFRPAAWRTLAGLAPRALAFALAFALAPAPVRAHDGLENQIARATAELLRSPDDPDLMLRRGDLLLLNGQPLAALEDYAGAGELRPGLELGARRARALLATGDAEAAERELDAHLQRHPADVQARLTRAEARTRLGRDAEAVADYEEAISEIEAAVKSRAMNPGPANPGATGASAIGPGGAGPNGGGSGPESTAASTAPAPVAPQAYLDRARAQERAGRPEDAVRGLDAAMAEIGPAASLQLEAIELEVRAGAFDRALARLDQVSAAATRKEEWLWRKGTILMRAGRADQARAAWGEALRAAESAPEGRKRGKAHRELIEKIRAALDTAETTASPTAGQTAGKPAGKPETQTAVQTTTEVASKKSAREEPNPETPKP